VVCSGIAGNALLTLDGFSADEASNFHDAKGFKSVYGFSAGRDGNTLRFGREIACNKTECG
jgi:hypothetical protein